MIELFVIAFLHGKVVASAVAPHHYRYDTDCDKAAQAIVNRHVKSPYFIEVKCRIPEQRGT